MHLHKNHKVYVVYILCEMSKLKDLWRSQLGSRVRHASGNILKTVKDCDIVTVGN